MEKKMENEMETREYVAVVRVYKDSTFAHGWTADVPDTARNKCASTLSLASAYWLIALRIQAYKSKPAWYF